MESKGEAMSELRELDQQVAQSLMGWVWYNAHGCSMLVPRSLPESFDMRWMREHVADHSTHEKRILTGLDFRAGISLPHYSDEIAAAFQVVEKMRSDGWSFACTLYEGKLPYASFCKLTAASSRNAEADSLPEAICRAALQCVKEKAKAAGG